MSQTAQYVRALWIGEQIPVPATEDPDRAAQFWFAQIATEESNRLFSGVYPAGIVYADREKEVNGDYQRLGFLDYATLTLQLEPHTPPELAAQIRTDAANIQAKRGQLFEISSSGQTVMLGSSLPKS